MEKSTLKITRSRYLVVRSENNGEIAIAEVLFTQYPIFQIIQEADKNENCITPQMSDKIQILYLAIQNFLPSLPVTKLTFVHIIETKSISILFSFLYLFITSSFPRRFDSKLHNRESII